MRVGWYPQGDDLHTPLLIGRFIERGGYDAAVITPFFRVGNFMDYKEFGKKILVDVRCKGVFALRVATEPFKGWYLWQVVASNALDAGLGLYPHTLVEIWRDKEVTG